MFKNSLFSKIVFIFTLPVLGILYFSSITVLDKTELLNDFKKNELKVEYLKESQNIISSLEKEKILSLNFFKDPQKLDSLLEQQSSTTQKIEKINKLIDNLPWKDNWKEQLTNLKISFTSLDEFRQKILKDELDENSIKKHYNELIKDIIEPLFY